MQNYYSTKPLKRKAKKSPLTITLLIVFAAVVILGAIAIAAEAEGDTITCWILCKPGAQVNARRTPDKRGQIVGFLEVGDEFRTTGESRNGYIRAIGIGEAGEAWIYCGYVVTEKPEKAGENYVCVAKNRVACRRWVNGPQIDGRAGWLKNGSNVQVFYRTEEWCVTSRGYIRTEWLEEAPL